jgi:hypothetical protein
VTTWEFDITGRPYPKGSLKCLGGKPGSKHTMVEQVEGSRPWKIRMIAEIRRQSGVQPVKVGNRVIGWKRNGADWAPIEAPLWVGAIFRFWPVQAKGGGLVPSSQTAFPVSGDFGDLDKLCRNLGDALEQSGLIANDRQIASWDSLKAWCPDGEAPGVHVVVNEL